MGWGLRREGGRWRLGLGKWEIPLGSGEEGGSAGPVDGRATPSGSPADRRGGRSSADAGTGPGALGVARIPDLEPEPSQDLRHPELEAALHERPDDGEAREVYADWLESVGDPRGERIRLERSLEAAGGADLAVLEARARELDAEHRWSWLGPELREIVRSTKPKKREALDGMLRIGWRGGFMDSIRVVGDWNWKGPAVAEILAAATASPSARFLRELRIGALVDEPFGPVVEAALRHGPLEHLRALVVGDFTYPDELEISWAELGDVSALFEGAPRLEDLWLKGGGLSLRRLEHGGLRRIKAESGGMPAGAVQTLAAARIPSLEDLEIWTGDPSYGGGESVDALASLFSPKAPERLPNLRRLGLCNCAYSDDFVERFVEAPLLPQLERLSLAKGTLSDRGARVLLDHADRLGHLVELDVDECCLSPEAEDSLRARFGTAFRAELQRIEDDDDFYVAVGE